ncbi:MAG TPA: hypothetical protein VKB87_11485, partial [Myxococcaceae bacterium]|nr:hypothetical protein [Myxococcaceae bacterium]
GLPLTASRVIAGISPPQPGPFSGTLRVSSSSSAAGAPSSSVQLLVHSADRKFTVGDQLPVLRVGNRVFRSSRYGDGGDTSTLIFSASDAPTGAATLQNGSDQFVLVR